MISPVIERANARIDLISAYEKDLIAVLGRETLIRLYQLEESDYENVAQFYQSTLSDADIGRLKAILGDKALLSDRIIRLKAFFSEKTSGVVRLDDFEQDVLKWLDDFEQDVLNWLKESSLHADSITCIDAVVGRELDILKRVRNLGRKWGPEVLRHAQELAKTGSEEERAKSEKIVEWILSEEPSWAKVDG